MNEIIIYIEEIINDGRQQSKVRHKMSDIIGIVLFAMLANANEWEEIAGFAKEHENFLRKYLTLENGIPSHDTIRRVYGMINPEILQQIQNKWNELLNNDEGAKLKKIINIDGKTMRDSGRGDEKPHHVVSAWSKEDGFCLGQKAVHEKSNEITAIPELLKTIQIKNQIVTIDAMGTQSEIATQINKQHGYYVLAVKRNQLSLYEDITGYFDDVQLCESVKSSGNYLKTIEKAHNRIETREYYQTSDILWLNNKKNWTGVKSVGMVRNTYYTGNTVITEQRYYICSIMTDIALFERAVRGHWAIESMHWHLDVTFREDYNTTIDKNAALNLNIMRKLCLSILKLIEVREKKTSLKLKRFFISMNPERYLAAILDS